MANLCMNSDSFSRRGIISNFFSVPAKAASLLALSRLRFQTELTREVFSLMPVNSAALASIVDVQGGSHAFSLNQM